MIMMVIIWTIVLRIQFHTTYILTHRRIVTASLIIYVDTLRTHLYRYADHNDDDDDDCEDDNDYDDVIMMMMMIVRMTMMIMMPWWHTLHPPALLHLIPRS
jgi:hypothetical protein